MDVQGELNDVTVPEGWKRERDESTHPEVWKDKFAKIVLVGWKGLNDQKNELDVQEGLNDVTVPEGWKLKRDESTLPKGWKDENAYEGIYVPDGWKASGALELA